MTSSREAPAPKRSYDNRRRMEAAARTRERIVDAGAQLVRETSIRDWREVTIAAVAARAEVHQRTVYRHFASERALRDAVMGRLELQAGVELDGLGLGDVAGAAVRILRFVSAYPLERQAPLDPTLVEANRRQHDALLAAVKEHAGSWPSADRTVAASMLDLLWAVGSYQRLVDDWGLDLDDALRGITWVIELIEDAVRSGRRPAGRPT